MIEAICICPSFYHISITEATNNQQNTVATHFSVKSTPVGNATLFEMPAHLQDIYHGALLFWLWLKLLLPPLYRYTAAPTLEAEGTRFIQQ